MNAEQIMKIFADTAYIRTGGSPENRKLRKGVLFHEL